MNSAIEPSPPVAGRAFEVKPSFDVDAFARNYGGVTVSMLKSGAVVFAQGEPATCMFHLQRGQIQITVVSPQGKEAIIAVLEPGDFSGEGCLLGDRLRVATAVCIADSTVVRLERASVIRAVRQDPIIAEFFLVYALTGVVRLREDLVSHLFDSSEKRLARALLLLANCGKNGRQETIISNVDQESLAQMIGTTRSRVNFFMNKFRKLGYIDYNGYINVHSSLLNVVLHNDSLDVVERVAASPARIARN
jgi:CRP/FNR family cyclic AMP-dependent transcriptional regulator